MVSVLDVDESPGKMYALATVLIWLASVAVALRCWARRMTKVGLAWDDFLIVIALLFTIATGACMLQATARGDLGRHTEILADGWPVFSTRLTILMQMVFATQLTSTLAFGFTKLAVLFFYKRLISGAIFNVAVWTVIVMTIGWTVAFFFANLLQCLPLSVNWIEFGATPEACIDTSQMYIAQGWSDIFTDVIILSLPIPSILLLKMPRSSKITVLSLLLLGTLVAVASITRLVVLYKVIRDVNSGSLDMAYILTPTVYWLMVEASLGIVGASLPSMRPILRRYTPEGGFRELRDRTSLRPFFSRLSNPLSELRRRSQGEAPSSSLESLREKPEHSKHERPTTLEDNACCDSRW